MSTLATADYAAEDYAADVPPLRVSVESLRCLLLWLTGFSGAFVFIEPSPYEVMSLFTATIFVISGLTLQAALIPLLALLFFYNLGFWIAVVPVINEEKTLSWVLISGYLSVTAIFFAAMLAKNTQQRLSVLCSGFTLGAIIAALAGIAGYFHLVPQFSEYERARGTFNDPNVLGAFLIFPAMLALQKLYSGRFFQFLGGGLMLGLYAAAVLLSFSRAAWGQLAFAAVVMTVLLFMTSRSPRQRLRIAMFALLAVIALAAVVALLFSVESVAEMFRQRASFEQSYDTGHFGRFGRHILGFDLALDKPWGIGPFQFRRIFPEDPHNVFLN
jgi:O-antigen ligase